MTPTSLVVGARPLRVVVTCDWFLKYAAAQAAALARAGAAVVLLCRTHANEFGGDVRERASTLQLARDAGVELLEIPGRLWDPRVARSLIRIRRRLIAIGPDVVHAHDSADPRGLALLRGIPTVLTVHDPAPHPGHPVPGARKRWFLDGSRAAWRSRARVTVVHSEPLRHELALSASQRCVVMPHGLELLADPLSPPREPVVGFFGRLTAYKGLEVLALAMPRVWETRPEIRLRVAGSGTSTLALQDSRVQVQRTYLPEAGVADFFGQVSVAVLPYTQASQTGAGSLAVGFGVPVIVSRVGGLPDLALDESYVFEAGDDAGLATAILRHVDDGATVRQRVLSEVAAPRSWDSVALCSMDLYRELRAA